MVVLLVVLIVLNEKLRLRGVLVKWYVGRPGNFQIN